MIRQQRRRQLREAEKELDRLNKDKFFIGLMADKQWEGLPEVDMQLLAHGNHVNKLLQRNYSLAMAYMRAIVTLETRIAMLKNEDRSNI